MKTKRPNPMKKVVTGMERVYNQPLLRIDFLADPLDGSEFELYQSMMKESR
jgi:hypothetical protein